MAETPPNPITTLPPSIKALMLPNEEFLIEIRKHFIGIIFIYLAALVAAVSILGFVIIVGPGIFLENQNFATFTALSVFAVALLVFIVLIATYVYRQNKIIVTNQSIIQTLQRGLFSRKVSRLSMADVEDVTADQHGIFPSLFNYGTLIVETAGELRNFVFTYCPDPNKLAMRILEARQEFLDQDGP